MKQRGQRRERIGTRRGHLARHVHLYASYAAERQLHLHRTVVKAFVNRRQRAAQTLRRLRDGESRQRDGPHVRHEDLAVGRHRGLDGHLRIAPHVDYHLVARAQHIVVGGGYAEVGFERKPTVGEQIVSEYPTRSLGDRRDRIATIAKADTLHEPLLGVGRQTAPHVGVNVGLADVNAVCRRSVHAAAAIFLRRIVLLRFVGILRFQFIDLTLRQRTVAIRLQKFLITLRARRQNGRGEQK